MPRVISGSARGHSLKTLEGDSTRPTSDRAKEAIFSSLGQLVYDARVLDLCAGSGQLGIEALSRSAEFAIFVEQNRKAVQVIRENLEKTKLTSKAEVLHMPVEKALPRLEARSFDLIFLDPPYKEASTLLRQEAVAISNLLKLDGMLIVEQASLAFVEQNYENLKIIKHCKYGAAMVSFYNIIA